MNVISFIKRALQGITGGAVSVADDNPLPVYLAVPPSGSTGDAGATLTKTSVTMTGASAALVAAGTTRSVVIVSNTDSNAPAVVDPTGGTAALDAGVPILPGATVKFTGTAARSAMTQIGTNTQKLTVYTG